MSRISVDVSSARIPVLQVGYQGENEVTDVLFDISSWIAEFGEGVAQLRVKRPGNSEEESYVLSLTITDGIALWTVSETDTFNKGNGKVQLSYLVGNIVKKAVVYPYKVGKSIVGADNPVDPFDSWIERSKAWATGKTLDGNDVPETDETYQNNAKYYAEQADILGSAQVVLATEQVTLATEKATLATEKAGAAAESEANAAASEANAAASEAAVNGVSTQLTTRMSAIETEQSVQSARMDTFTSLPEGSTSGNAELADIRVGAAGITYDTAGNAVRGQISELKSDLTKLESSITEEHGDISLKYVDKSKMVILDAYIEQSSGIIKQNANTKSLYFKCKKNTLYTLNNIASTAPNKVFRFGTTSIIPTYGVTVDNYNMLDGLSTREITTDDNDEYIVLNYYIHNTDASKTPQEVFDDITVSYNGKDITAVDKKARYEVDLSVKKSYPVFDATKCVDGIIQPDGGVTSASNYKSSEYMPIKKGHKYTIKVARKIALYNDKLASTMISGSYVDAEVENYVVEPSTDCYLRFTYYSTSSTDVIVSKETDGSTIEEGILLSNTLKSEVKDIINSSSSKNILSNKKWCACGDSFTSWTTETYKGSDYPNITNKDGNYKTYPFWIGSRNNMTVLNYAQSGETITTPTGAYSNIAFTNNIYKTIPLDVDYITLWFGINDASHIRGDSQEGESVDGTITLGTIDDTSVNTFYGAWNTVCEYLLTNYPYAHIGIIITNGTQNPDIVNAEIAIAQKWGIAYLDLNGDYKVPLMNRVDGKANVCEKAKQLRKSAFQVPETETGAWHPNVKAHEYESTFIENFLRSL